MLVILGRRVVMKSEPERRKQMGGAARKWISSRSNTVCDSMQASLSSHQRTAWSIEEHSTHLAPPDQWWRSAFLSATDSHHWHTWRSQASCSSSACSTARSRWETPWERLLARQARNSCILKHRVKSNLIPEGDGTVSTGKPSRLRFQRLHLHRRDVVFLTHKGIALLAPAVKVCQHTQWTCDRDVREMCEARWLHWSLNALCWFHF